MASGVAFLPLRSPRWLRSTTSLGVKRQVTPFQWVPAPPSPSPSGNAPQRRIGSAVSDGSCRMVIVSVAVSSMSSRRNRYLSSSRTPGSVKSSAGMRCVPRSSATTLSPALVSSRATMLLLQPAPTRTASTAFIVLAIDPSPSAEVRDRLRLDVDFLAAIGFRLGAVARRQAGIADHAPGHLVAIAAIDGVGEEAFHRRLVERLEKRLGVEVGELRLPLIHRLERGVAVGRREPVEILAVGLARPGVGRPDASGEEFARRQRQLVAVLRLALLEWAAAIEPRAVAPSAGELAVDVGKAPAIGAGRRKPIRRNKGIVGGGEERRLGRGEGQIDVACWSCGGGGRCRKRVGRCLRLSGVGGRGQRGCNRCACRARALQEAAPRKSVVRHVVLPRGRRDGARLRASIRPRRARRKAPTALPPPPSAAAGLQQFTLGIENITVYGCGALSRNCAR